MRNQDKKVWILDDEWLTHDLEKELYQENGLEVKVSTSQSLMDDFEAYGKDADGIVAQVGFQLGADLISHLTNCKIIASSGVGFNHIDLEAAKEKGIYVSNQPEYCLGEVADHTLALALTVARRLRAYNEQVKAGKWDPLDTLPIYRLQNRTVGLLGFGRIAREVSKRFKAFGLEVIAYDKYADEAVFKAFDVKQVSFETLLEASDILSLHVALTEETKGLINYETMKKLPKDALIINTCRGEIINEADLVKVMKEGHLAGAGLDVLISEPPDASNELLHMDEVFVTPHASYVSQESEQELRSETSLNIIRAIRGEKPHYIVNALD